MVAPISGIASGSLNLKRPLPQRLPFWFLVRSPPGVGRYGYETIKILTSIGGVMMTNIDKYNGRAFAIMLAIILIGVWWVS